MKKIIIGNWKLNLDHLEAIQLIQKLNYSLNADIDEKITIVVAPSHTSLRSIPVSYTHLTLPTIYSV